MTKIKQAQIDFLNRIVKVKMAPSKIHGVGIFALRDIAQGEKLYADYTPAIFNLTYNDIKNLRLEIREILLGQWPQIINGSVFAYPTTRIQAYINHSDQNNYDAKNDVVLTDIKAGEEITENYRDIENYARIFPWLENKEDKE